MENIEVNKEQAEKELDVKKKPESGWIRILRANMYKSHMIYIRQLGKYRFEYLLEYNGEVYAQYIIIKPEGKSRRKLTDGEVSQAAALIYNGATATLDMLLGDYVEGDDKEVAETFEKFREQLEEKDGKEEK
jgi:hypothetical protein